MSLQHSCPCAEHCILQSVMNSIGGKWKLPVLCSLTADGATRYNDLLRRMNGISNTMLSKSLKELETDGLITRSEYIEVPIRVEYELSDKGKRLRPVLEQLILWYLSEQADTAPNEACK